jgi:hypothetical protein
VSNTRKARRPVPPQDPVSVMITALDGARIPGGCDHCDAYQDITANACGHRGVHLLTIRHDDDCPELARRR